MYYILLMIPIEVPFSSESMIFNIITSCRIDNSSPSGEIVGRQSVVDRGGGSDFS